MESSKYNTFEVRNNDVLLHISCKNYGKHLQDAIDNLCVNQYTDIKNPILSYYATDDDNTEFLFDNEVQKGKDIMRDAVFFENTDYPLMASSLHDNVKITALYIAGHSSKASFEYDSNETTAYGSLNFHNQVGRTDISVHYLKDGEAKKLSFRTEVLSYKTDYRIDLKCIIADIEQEYAMLSYSFLKQTYLSFKEKNGKSTDLIWWQIFQQCYNSIINSAKIIINSPKRRLKREVKYERAERLRSISFDLEQEYSEFQDDPHHLYRVEDLYLSKDTIENRFLKYAIREIYRRFGDVRTHIKNTLKVDDTAIAENLVSMDEELNRLVRHSFFRQIGQFKGFSQDSLVMKRARGYSDILKNWVLLQCGYELEEGIRKLEVKDISELYEIWSFIKVKNIVRAVLGQDILAKTSGKELSSGFVKQLAYGKKTDVHFKRNDIDLAILSYNPQVEEEESSIKSAIDGTTSFTTIQRPDIVLRISKTDKDDIVYTYVFDAKYRLAENKYQGKEDVPPVDAIDQIHRYRDAIYNIDDVSGIKREIIGGSVLYPGKMSAQQVRDSYYYSSHQQVGVGAFPLKPALSSMDQDGNLELDINSSDKVLYDMISAWLNDTGRRHKLVKKTIPQKGLKYIDEKESERLVLISRIDKNVNNDIQSLTKGVGRMFVSDSSLMDFRVNLQNITYLAVVSDNLVAGIYKIESMEIVNMTEVLNKEKTDLFSNDLFSSYENKYRIKFTLGEFERFNIPKIVDIDNISIMSRLQFDGL